VLMDPNNFLFLSCNHQESRDPHSFICVEILGSVLMYMYRKEGSVIQKRILYCRELEKGVVRSRTNQIFLYLCQQMSIAGRCRTGTPSSHPRLRRLPPAPVGTRTASGHVRLSTSRPGTGTKPRGPPSSGKKPSP
jgi:hypothetical protein